MSTDTSRLRFSFYYGQLFQNASERFWLDDSGGVVLVCSLQAFAEPVFLSFRSFFQGECDDGK